ncbi:MipA/OmpV family protein [Allosediminivita pacifica]|uniref:Outer membrane scaffolding protein for murein synthesis (MipA/OmpV family) n=1 Tax=Allosediminivita pacifica TaxID=1267769 RepID=A0A2T6B3Q4_9RHOB|nr:MipA/OmpV family protein [Allosediminivita pacifica]PTX50710.1 outer membrane scaffolding protein for murein synthesis (MipA/OmpV family) [Allosediminivita pacifica]
MTGQGQVALQFLRKTDTARPPEDETMQTKTLTLPLIASGAVLCALPAAAQQRQLQFELGAGAKMAPAYEGSEDYEASPSFFGSVSTLNFWFLDLSTKDGNGFAIGPSFGVVSDRDDGDHDRLEGIDDVDFALELGLKAKYRYESWEVFGAIRQGVTGHEGLVGDLGVDYIAFPSLDSEFRIGPRVTYADDEYMETYFSVPNGARLASYDADGGLKSYGLEMSYKQDLTEKWAVKGTVTWDRLAGDVEDSPIVQDRDQGSVGVTLIREFDWRW